MSFPVVIIGAGGHGKVVADALVAMGRTVKGFIDVDPARWTECVNDMQVLGGEDLLSSSDAAAVELANGVGSVDLSGVRRAVFERFHARAFRFVTIVHPGAIVSPRARLAEGAQVMAGAIVQAGAVIGENTILNTGAIVDHDCKIGAHCHLAPGCTLSGNVSIGTASHIGTGASVRHGVSLGERTLVGAGAAVVSNHPGGATLVGVPARVRL